MRAQRFTLSTLMDILVSEAGLPPADRSGDPAATLADIGLDSLAFFQVQAKVQDWYGFELADDSPQQTFGEIIAQVEARLAGAAAGRTP